MDIKLRLLPFPVLLCSASKDSGSSFRYAGGIRVLGCFWFSAMVLFIAHHVVLDMSNEPSEGDPFKRSRVDFGVTCDDFTPAQPGNETTYRSEDGKTMLRPPTI